MMKTIFLTILLFVIFSSAPHSSHAALLYTGAANQVVYVDQSFVVEWMLDTQDSTINSISLVLTYPKDKLEVLEASAGNSALDLWVKQPQFSNQDGTIKLIGGISGGLKNNKLPIFRATFKPLQTGEAKLSMSTDSQLLQADGLGTPTPLIFNEVNFIINPADAQPAFVSSPSHPDQDEWYKNNNVTIKVDQKDREEYSYSFSSNLEMIPDASPDDIKQPIQFKDLLDGIYYFKLNSKTGPSDWQEAAVYVVRIDTTPPKEFTPTITSDPAVFDGQAFVAFNTSDNISGVSYYAIKSNFFSGWQETNEGYFKLPGLVLGDTIEVKVVDAAGNERITEVKVDKSVVNSVFSKPIFWVIILISLFAAVVLVLQYLKLLKKYKVNDK